MRPRWGSHVSSGAKNLSDLIDEVHAAGMSCFQIFLGDSEDVYKRRILAPNDMMRSEKKLRALNISMNTHFPYKLNMCRSETTISGLQDEVTRVGDLGGRVVVHTGSCVHGKHTNRDLPKLKEPETLQWRKDWRQGADTLIEHLNNLAFPNGDEIVLLLEPPAGEGKKLGWRLDQIAYIFDKCPAQVGFCLDTCHAFAAGACRFDSADNVEKFFADLGKALGGIEKLKLIHLNDSEDNFGDMKDNHAPLTHGNIWKDEQNLEGLVALWLFAKEHNVDIVSEVGSEVDIDIMKRLYEGSQ
jgi:endonuclease IV